jgi:hypothetical protein
MANKGTGGPEGLGGGEFGNRNVEEIDVVSSEDGGGKLSGGIGLSVRVVPSLSFNPAGRCTEGVASMLKLPSLLLVVDVDVPSSPSVAMSCEQNGY